MAHKFPRTGRGLKIADGATFPFVLGIQKEELQACQWQPGMLEAMFWNWVEETFLVFRQRQGGEVLVVQGTPRCETRVRRRSRG